MKTGEHPTSNIQRPTSNAEAVFYNDNDPRNVAWLSELARRGLIARGTIDGRSILDIHAYELASYRQVHLFAGIGGWSYALRLAGVPDDEPWWTVSCPCQPLSCAGQRRGDADERHLWPAVFERVAECRPAAILGEQVASPDGREWFAGVRADLEGAGYACGAADLCAAGVGAPHGRQRLYWVAYSHDRRCDPRGGGEPERAQSKGGNGQLEQRGGAGGMGDAARGGRGELRDAARPGCGGHFNCADEPLRVAAAQRAGLEGLAGNGADGDEPGRHRAQPHGSTSPTGGAGAGGLEHADRAGSQPGRPAAAGDGYVGAVEPAGGDGGLGDPEGERRAGRPDGEDGGRGQCPPGLAGAWSDYDICTFTGADAGKARRIEAGTFPLAHGVPARLGRLRGYGNAIVPQVAARFIQAARPLR
jgi:DNA (cytosine-5)-methyltransferase 1